jgi:hypothetical protein
MMEIYQMSKVRMLLASAACVATIVASVSVATPEETFQTDIAIVKEALLKADTGPVKEAAEAALKLAEELDEKKDYEGATKALEKAAQELGVKLSEEAAAAK